MSHKFFFSIISFSLAAALCSCGGTKHSGKSATLPGSWQALPIVIDGDSKDWPSPYPNYDAKSMVAYATSNDSRNLYITMETGDELTQMKILKQGMVVSVDTNGKRDPQLNINYPLPNDNETLDIPKQGSHFDGSSYAAKKWAQSRSSFAKEANQYSLEGFKNCNGGYVITQTAPCGIRVIMKIDEYKQLVWEAVIPFRAIYGRDSITAADAGKPISVCFAVNRFKRPETKAENNSGMNNTMNSASMQGPGGSGGGGAPRSGGRNISGDPMEHLYENTKTWKQFGLAYQQH